MKKVFKSIIYLLVLFISFISICKAEEEITSVSTTKYYKTITYYDNILSSYNISGISKTYEISEEEYESVDSNKEELNRPSATVETTYKKMTTSITQNGSYYRYKNILNWKIIPKIKSYDIIAIGHFQTVKVHGSTHFEEYYCYTSGSCSTAVSNYPQTFSTGAGTSFPLPSGSLSTLRITFYFDVEKNTPYTIITQDAYGDYSHAITNISLANSKKYTVNYNGISLNNSVISYFDTMQTAIVTLDAIW